MKAKMPNKPAEAATYICNVCRCQFRLDGGELVCPKCKNAKRSDFAIVDIRDNPQEEKMYTEDDWHGG